MSRPTASPPEELPPGEAAGHSRRAFFKVLGLAAGASAVIPSLSAADEKPAPKGRLARHGRSAMEVALTLNGKPATWKVEPRTTLLDALRDGAGMTGTKEVCSRGACGACSVLLDGVAVCSCLMLAADAAGRTVTTIEGIAEDPRHAALIEAFCDHDAAQCGFCIPGFVVRSAALLDEHPRATPADIRHGLAGNICRCGTYTKIFEAVESVARGEAS